MGHHIPMFFVLLGTEVFFKSELMWTFIGDFSMGRATFFL